MLISDIALSSCEIMKAARKLILAAHKHIDAKPKRQDKAIFAELKELVTFLHRHNKTRGNRRFHEFHYALIY